MEFQKTGFVVGRDGGFGLTGEVAMRRNGCDMDLETEYMREEVRGALSLQRDDLPKYSKFC